MVSPVSVQDSLVTGQVSGRLTLDSTDNGAFKEIDVWTVYHKLTRNHPNERDAEAMGLLAASGFSSSALVRLFEVIKAKHGSRPIHSLNFFASSIQELVERITAAQTHAARTCVGGSAEDRQQVRLRAIAREINAWARGALQRLAGSG